MDSELKHTNRTNEKYELNESMIQAGFEYLLAYKITIPIYDYTVEFCRRHRTMLSSQRTQDQMVQAARSGTQNIAEGYTQESLEGYIKLAGVNRGSLEELLKDYLAFARQNHITIWEAQRGREIREIGVIWEIIRKTPTLPTNPAFPDLPDSPEITVNLMITLINQANLLNDRLIDSLKNKFVKEGGFRENLFKKRAAYRSKGQSEHTA